MRYLEKALKFAFKNYMLSIPLLIVTVIPAIFSGIGQMFFMVNFTSRFRNLITSIFQNSNLENQMNLYPGNNINSFLDFYPLKFIIFSVIALLLTIVLAIIFYPVQYGLITKKYETGNVTVADVAPSISKYIGRYILYGLLAFAIILGVAVVFGLLVFVSAIVITFSLPVGIILLILSIMAYIAGIVAITVYMSLWMPAICTEDCSIISGLKQSFKTVKGSFWMILGVSLLVWLCSAVAGGILSLIVGWIPIAGTVIGSVVSGFVNYILIIFYFEVYREKTGRYGIPYAPEQLPNI